MALTTSRSLPPPHPTSCEQGWDRTGNWPLGPSSLPTGSDGSAMVNGGVRVGGGRVGGWRESQGGWQESQGGWQERGWVAGGLGWLSGCWDHQLVPGCSGAQACRKAGTSTSPPCVCTGPAADGTHCPLGLLMLGWVGHGRTGSHHHQCLKPRQQRHEQPKQAACSSVARPVHTHGGGLWRPLSRRPEPRG